MGYAWRGAATISAMFYYGLIFKIFKLDYELWAFTFCGNGTVRPLSLQNYANGL